MARGKGSFEYVGKDYDSIRSALIDRIPLMSDRWTDRNESDPGMVLLELFSGVSDMLAYYLDINANQAFLPTATQREPVMNICTTIDYQLANATAASGYLLFTRTPEVTTGSATTLASTIIAEATSTFTINAPFGDYGGNDAIYLNNGIAGEFCRIASVDGFGSVTIYGVTQYSYTAGDVVERIDSDKRVQITSVKCKTKGATSEYFETTNEGVYMIEPGNSYVDEARILEVNTTLNQLVLTNANRYVDNDAVFIQDLAIGAQNDAFLISEVSGSTITLIETLPTWITKYDTIARLVPATHGETKEETLGSSDGNENQEFYLSFSPVVGDSILLEIDEGIGYEEWIQVDHFLDSDSNSEVYTVLTEATEESVIQFGDNINGKIPAVGSPIKSTYTKGGGLIGNIGAGTIPTIDSAILDDGGIPISLTVLNPDAMSGGTDKETIESAKVQAPASLRALNRCVSTEDYATLALNYSSDWGRIAIAYAVELEFDNSVAVYVWTEGTNGMASTASIELRSDIQEHLLEHAVATMSVTVQNGSTLPINITGTIYIHDNVSNVEAETIILEAIDSLFYVDNLEVGADFYLGNIYEILENLDEVERADIQAPLRPGVIVSHDTVPTRGTVSIVVVGGY